MFDHERLRVYQFAVEFDAFVVGLVKGKTHRSLWDQLERASSGVMACIAEGAGRRSPPDKRKYYAMARGSAAECAAHLDALRVRGAITTQQVADGKTLLRNIINMLSKLSAPEPP
jgi:four helix bundle protein